MKVTAAVLLLLSLGGGCREHVNGLRPRPSTEIGKAPRPYIRGARVDCLYLAEVPSANVLEMPDGSVYPSGDAPFEVAIVLNVNKTQNYVIKDVLFDSSKPQTCASDLTKIQH